MDTAYAAVCMLCGRDLGYIRRRRFIAKPGAARIRREGRRFRCGHCRGSVLFEPDPSLAPPDWVAEMEREVALAR